MARSAHDNTQRRTQAPVRSNLCKAGGLTNGLNFALCAGPLHDTIAFKDFNTFVVEAHQNIFDAVLYQEAKISAARHDSLLYKINGRRLTSDDRSYRPVLWARIRFRGGAD